MISTLEKQGARRAKVSNDDERWPGGAAAPPGRGSRSVARHACVANVIMMAAGVVPIGCKLAGLVVS